MVIPAYGHISCELPQVLVLIKDIGRIGGLRQGGKQYPNVLCCHDGAASLRKVVGNGDASSEGYSSECVAAIVKLAAFLDHIGREAYVLTGEGDAVG